MNRFAFSRVATIEAAVTAASGDDTRFLAGGTNLVDLLKENVERPARLIDIGRLPLAGIEDLPGGGLRLGALTTNADTASDPRILERFPLLASAILAGRNADQSMAATL